LYCLSCYNKYRTSGFFYLEGPSFQIIGEVFLVLLDKAIEFKDYETARFTMILSQTFYSGSCQNKISLQTKIDKHEIWNKIEFWEDFFICNITFINICIRLLRRRNGKASFQFRK